MSCVQAWRFIIFASGFWLMSTVWSNKLHLARKERNGRKLFKFNVTNALMYQSSQKLKGNTAGAFKNVDGWMDGRTEGGGEPHIYLHSRSSAFCM